MSVETGHEAGQKCPFCFQIRRLVVRDDLRSDEEKRKYPMSEKDLTIVACGCLHPGDYMVGGFF